MRLSKRLSASYRIDITREYAALYGTKRGRMHRFMVKIKPLHIFNGFFEMQNSA
jgi:hypothetical protein